MTQTMQAPVAQGQAQPVYEISEDDRKRVKRIELAWKAYNGELDAPLTKPDNIIAMPQGKDNEWYTPAQHIQAVHEVMGSIDLDPASCELANQTVRAKQYYSVDDDGLTQEWHGRIYLNPPYGMNGAPRDIYGGQKISVANLWIQRLITEYKAGNVSQAILLTKADPKQRWFQPLWEYVICFADRVYFNRPNLPPERNQFGTAFTYLGPNEQKFIDTFSKFGTIAKRVSTPKQQPVNLSLWEVQ